MFLHYAFDAWMAPFRGGGIGKYALFEKYEGPPLWTARRPRPPRWGAYEGAVKPDLVPGSNG
jgi:hypothetical protein